jgi:hypothetical protein
MTGPEAASEAFVLQERKPGADWEDIMSLAAWHDPAVRSEALAIFRDSEECPPGTGYRMVRRTESVLVEDDHKAMRDGKSKPPAVKLLEEALFLRMNGERPPGGTSNWRDWDSRAEVFLRGLLPPEAEGSS